jgi:hypothetical protein
MYAHNTIHLVSLTTATVGSRLLANNRPVLSIAVRFFRFDPMISRLEKLGFKCSIYYIQNILRFYN